VRPVNDAPVVTGGMQNLHHTTSLALAGNDVDGDTLTYEIVAGPTHGTVTGVWPMLQYTAEPGFIGEDTVTYRAHDGKVASQPGTIYLEVAAGSAPRAFDNSFSAVEDQPRAVVLGADDPDFDPLTFTIETPPQHGTLSGTPPDLVYTPARDFNGSDSLQFSTSDGFVSSNTATVTLFVAAVNDAPVANPQNVAATEDTQVRITLTGSDVDGDGLAFQVLTSPSHGTLAFVTGGVVNYTPAANYHGPDGFTFAATDLRIQSSPATVTIDVASVEDPPVAAAFSRSVSEDTPSAITLLGSDGDGDPISYAVTSPPGHGSLSGTAPALTYTPADNYSGPDSFTYAVSSSGVTSLPGTVTLQVDAVNDAPVAVDSAVSTDEDTRVAITLQASDVDSAALTFTIVAAPAARVPGRGIGTVRAGTAGQRTVGRSRDDRERQRRAVDVAGLQRDRNRGVLVGRDRAIDGYRRVVDGIHL
jgi:hypothetical protein